MDQERENMQLTRCQSSMDQERENMQLTRCQSSMDQERENMQLTRCQSIPVAPMQNLHGSSVPGSETLVTDVLSQCPSSSSCNEPQPPIILSSDLCEITSKFEAESLIKVDSMLTEPCKYLKEVSVFDVDDAKDNRDHGLVDGSNIELDGSVRMLKADDANQSEKTLTGKSPGDDDRDQTMKRVVLQDIGEDKDSRMNLLDTAPFLMNEEGVVFQCFPVSEKEVFIVSLEDESLLMNEPLSEDHLPMPSESPSEIKMGNLEEAAIKQGVEITHPKFGGESQYPLLEAGGSDAYVDDVSTSSFMASSFHEDDRNCNSQNSKTVSSIVLDPSTNLACRSVPVSESNVCSVLTSNKNGKASPAVRGDEYQPKGMKVAHATIYAPSPPTPPPRKMRKGPSDSEEISSKLYKCFYCNEALPTSGTLRHHLVTKHQQRNLDSFMCFICQQDCWSASQLDWHLRIQHGIKNKVLACPVCATQFSTMTECRAHVRKHPTNLTCPSCPQKFAVQHLLTQHVKQHLEELQPFCCHLCGIRFTHPKVLEMHGWRHRSQTCPGQPCRHDAEDETWLLYHLQCHHKYSSQSLRALSASRTSEEYRMDIILVKYAQTQKNRLEAVPSNNQTLKSNTHEICVSEVTSPLVVDAEGNDSIAVNVMNDAADFDIEGQVEVSSSIIGDMVDTIVSLEEEEKKNSKRKAEILRKVFDGGTSLHRCGLCNTYHSSPEELAIHKAEHNQVLECVKCQRSFLSMKQLKRHMTVHSSSKDDQMKKGKGMNEHHCILCGKVFGSESALSRHSSTHARSEGRHQCKLCSRRVGTRAHLTEHMARVHKIHSDSKRIMCPMCDRRFVSNFHLNLHLITHGETKPLYSCKICNRNYLRPRSLRSHMSTHDQKFICNMCNESFPSARRLALHVRGHDPAYKSKVQCPKCPMAFPYKSQLEVHLRTHTGEKPYVCETCGKCFKRLQHCKVHLKVMHGNEKQPCVECGKQFSDKANLLRHRLKVHYHLNRWVCGVCAQSFAYSEDLRRHLKRKHDLTFERLLNADKKGMSEVYVIPELGSREISANTRTAIESICKIEKLKVKQIFSGVVPDLTKSRANDTEKMSDPDDPVPMRDNAVATRSVFIPSAATVGLSTVMGNAHLQTGEQTNSGFTTFVSNEVQGLMPLQVTGMKCAECGIEVVNPQQCGACGVLVCSQAHMDVHVASVHQVLFQCSVCGLHYNSQSDCVAHVTSTHTSHLLAVQGGTTAFLPQGQTPTLQGNLQGNSAAVQPQVCLPLTHTQPNPQCLLQVGGCPSQLPVVVAPAATSVAAQQIAAPNCVLPYPNLLNSVTSGIPVIPQGAALELVTRLEKQTVFAMTNIFPDQHHQQLAPNMTRMIKKEEPLPGTSLCTITLPPSNTENLCIPSDNNGVVMLSSKPNANVLSTILPHPRNSSDVSSIIVGNSELGGQQDNRTPVLLVDSVPTSTAVDGPTHVAPSHKQMNLAQQTSTSVASVLLALAETPQEEQSPVLVPRNTLRITDNYQDQVLSPSIVTDVSLGEVKKDVGRPSNSAFLQTMVDFPAQDKETQGQGSSISLTGDMQVTADSRDAKPPQEISVEIIQPQLAKSKSESKSAKSPSKKPSTSRTKRKKTSDSVQNEGYECKTCGKMLSCSSHLKRHETTHGVRRFKCEVCNKAFTEKYNLKIHTLTHTLERPHECSLCLKTFRYVRDLAEHKRTHEGTRPHVCDVCQKAFIRQRDLTRHQKEQHDTKRYNCKICGLSFKRRIYLKTVHMRIHHPSLIEANDEEEKAKETARSKTETKQSHICKICGRSFARARYLTSHLRTHSKRAYYVRCPMCPRMFSSEQTLKVHRETFHDHDHSLQGTSSMIIEAGQTISQGEGMMLNFDQPQTENLIISDAQGICDSPPCSLVITSQTSTTQLQSQSSKQSLLPSISLPVSVQQSYSVARSVDGIEASIQNSRMGHFDVNMDMSDPITYLSPSLSS